MAISHEILAARLRAARERAGITQGVAAAALGLPRTALVQIEGANRTVSSLELAKLAELYDVPIDRFFADEETAVPGAVEAVFRIGAGSELSDEAVQQVSHAAMLCREGVALERLMGYKPRSGPPAYELPPPQRKSEAVDQGVQTAADDRHRLGLSEAPIADMADLLAAQGIWASGAEFEDEVSGVFLRHPEFRSAILVNLHHNRARKRFSYAHEYAHALLDREDANQPLHVSSTKNRDQLREVRANAFAAAFLMPPEGVAALLRMLDKGSPSRTYTWVYDLATEQDSSKAIRTEERAKPGSQEIVYKDVAQVAHHFGVSYQAAAYRLRNLGWIKNQASLDELLAQKPVADRYLNLLGLFNYEAEDRGEADRELRSELAERVIEAFRRGVISRGRVLELAKLLGIEGKELLALAREAV